MKTIFALKPGSYTDKNGNQYEIDDNYIQDIVNATTEFVYQNDTFPITIGHPKEDSPAWGWVNKNNVAVKNGMLAIAVDETKDLVTEFSEWIKKGLYKTVSLSFYPKSKRIKHLAFLGATPPAVTGLPAVEFALAEEEAVVVELSTITMSGYWSRNIAELFRGVKNFMIEKFSLDEAEKVLPEYKLSEAAQAPSIWEEEKNPSTSFSITQNQEEDEMEIKELEAKNAELQAKLDEATQSITQMKTTATEKELTARRAEFSAWVEKDAVNKVKAGEEAETLELLMLASNTGAVEFSVGDEKKTLNPVDRIKQLILNQPDVAPVGEFSTSGNAATDGDEEAAAEFAGKNVDQDRLELHKKVTAEMKKTSCTYPIALKNVLKK